jgi:hypothetical protein
MTRSGIGRIALAAVVCLGVGLPVFAKGNPKQRRRAACQVRVTSTPDNPNGKRPVFSASEIDDLNFAVVFRTRRTPVDRMVMRVFMPTGDLYQEFEVPVAQPGSRKLERHVRGYPFPLKVRKARRWFPRYVVVDGPSLPVAGTYITNHSLWGMWRVEAWLDGADKPCQARFKITP